jgi:hypothetical protein
MGPPPGSSAYNPGIAFPSDRVASGWCMRRLMPRTLASVWDCPILVQDTFKSLGLETSLDLFVSSAPAKILALAADYFLTYGVRGGLVIGTPLSGRCTAVSARWGKSQTQAVPGTVLNKVK